ncbi:MAG: hypothetical protein IKM61_00360 [Eubacteriaceae bacterium]|nr:hypothetical protein [Eubacteriaceae bacterium]
MKGKTPKMLRSVMAMLLAVLMVAGSFGSVFAAEQKIEDVTVGDVQNIVNGAIEEVEAWLNNDGINKALAGLYDEIEKWIASEDGQAAIADVEAAIEGVKAAIEAEIAKVQAAAPEVKAQIETAIAELEGIIATLETEVAAKKAQIEAAMPQIEAAIKEEVAKLEAEKAQLEAKLAAAKAEVEAKAAELAALKAQFEIEHSEEIALAIEIAEAALGTAEEALAEVAGWVEPRIKETADKIEAVQAQTVATIIASIENAIANIEAKIDEVKATVAALETAVANIETALENLADDAEVAAAQLEALVNAELAKIDVEALEAGVDAVIAEVKEAVENQIATITPDTKVVDLVNAVLADAKVLAAAAVKEAETLAPYVEAELTTIVEALEVIAAEVDVEPVITAVETVAELVEKLAADIKAVGTTTIEEAINVVNTTVSAIEAGIKEIIAYIEGIFANAVEGELYIGPDTYYVAVGDSYVAGEKTYAEFVAEELGIEGTKVAGTGLRAEDILAILDATYTPDAYGKVVLETLGAEAVEAAKAEIAKADLITLSIGNDNFTKYIVSQIGETLPMDWAKYVGEEGIAYINEAKAEVVAALVAEGLEEAMAETVAVLVESYAYTAVGFSFNYAEAINAIHAINPEAEVVVVGTYNPFDGLVVEGVNVGEYVEYVVALINFQFYTYALLTDNTTFVQVPETETVLDVTGAANEMAYITALMNGTLAPSEAGHVYIKDQILDAVKLEGLLGDVNLDGKVNAIDATQILCYANNKASVFTEAEGALAEYLMWAADVNEDGKVNAIDATQILRFCNNKPSSLDK